MVYLFHINFVSASEKTPCSTLLRYFVFIPLSSFVFSMRMSYLGIALRVALLAIVVTVYVNEDVLCDSGSLDTICEVSTRHNFDVDNRCLPSCVDGKQYGIFFYRKRYCQLYLQL